MSTTYLLDRLMNEILLKEGKYDSIKPKYPGSFIGHRVEQEGKVEEVPSMLIFKDRSPNAPPAPDNVVKAFWRKNPNFNESMPEGPNNPRKIKITKLAYAKVAWVWDGKDWVTEDDYFRGRKLAPGELESVEDAEKRLGKDPVRVVDDPNTRLSYLERKRGRIVSDPVHSKVVTARPPFIIKKDKRGPVVKIKKESYIPKIALNVLREVDESEDDLTDEEKERLEKDSDYFKSVLASDLKPRGERHDIVPDKDTNCLDCNDMIVGCPSCASCKICNDFGCEACQPTHCEKCSLKLDWSGICKKCEPDMWYRTMIGE